MIKKYILLNKLGSKDTQWNLVDSSNITKEKFLSKNYIKNAACELVTGPLFLKNSLWKGIWGNLNADFDIFE